MKSVLALTAAAMIAAMALAGCGAGAPLEVSGKTYLNSQEEADSRTIQFKPDGTFVYTITTAESNTTNTGTYALGEAKVTLTFGPGRITELAGKTVELKQDGQLLVDPDGSRWMVYAQ